MINIKRITLIMFLVVTVFVSCSIAEVSGPAAEALGKMPAVNAKVEGELNAKLIKAGPEAIMQICDLIVPPGTGNDTKARYTLSSLSFYTSRPKVQSERKMYAAVLVRALNKASDKNVKSFFITQLRLVGGDESVPALGDCLSSDDLCDVASMALQTIGTEAAAKVILKALPNASQKSLPTIIHALGQMRVKSVSSKISTYATDTDRTLRLISLGAIAEIGDRSAIKIIKNAMSVKEPYEKALVVSYYINLANRLNDNGRTKDAVKICKSILKSKDPAIKSNIKSSVLTIITAALGEKSFDYLEDAFDDGDEQLQSAAMTLAVDVGGSSATKAWGKKLKKASPAKKIMLVEMLSARGDMTALVALRKTYTSSDDQVKTAILKALIQLDKAGALTDLLAAVGSSKANQVNAAKSLISQLPTDQFAAAATKLLPKLSSKGQVALIEILADKRVTESFDTVFSLTSSKDTSVSIAATKALANLAADEDVTKVIGIMLNAEASSQRSEASRVVVKLCSTQNGMGMSAQPLLDAAKGANLDQQISIIKILPSIGTSRALKVVESKVKSSDDKLSDAAIRSLAKWPNAEALDALFAIASTTEQLNYQVITIKAYVTLTLKSQLTDESKVDNFRKAFKVAKRQQEKKFVISKMSQLKAVEALQYAVELLSDNDQRADATKAVVRIALPAVGTTDGLSGPGVGALLLDAYTKIPDADIRKRIDAYVKIIPSLAGRGNLALNKPVSISCAQEGAHSSKYAVDGQKANKAIAYFGASSPSWLQVDIGKVSPVASAHVWFYWDTRYYQYTIEVSADGKKFTQVVDQSKNTTPATPQGVSHHFASIDARYIRLNILKNSANPSVHVVEFEVYPTAKKTRLQQAAQVKPPEGFTSLFNGKDLTGWKGLMASPNDNPAKRAKLNAEVYNKEQAKADALMNKHWHVVDGVLYFDGGGHSLATAGDYGDFEMYVDWKLMHDRGDSGIYLRGSPQVQIWDPAQHKTGSGGLYNNKKNPSKPSVIADNPIGQWNTFHIKMIGEKVTVRLNGKLVVDDVTLENYWDKTIPIFSREQIELQCHGNPVCFKNIFIKEIKRPGEFISLFNGRDLTGWIGDTKGYIVKDGSIVCQPGGNLYTEKQYSDFVLRFEFKLTPGANNGLGIRTPKYVNAAYSGMELQILDNTAQKYEKLKPYQYHGSIYGVYAAERGFLKLEEQWNHQEVIANGNQITVILNGTTIVPRPDDKVYKSFVDIKELTKNGIADGKAHPGLLRKGGHIGFLGHGDEVHFKDITINELK